MNKTLRHKIANYLLYREMKHQKREQKSVPFNEAKTIGILYDATIERDYELVKKFVKEIRDQHKDVLALGYYDKKELPNTRFVKLGLDFFTKKHLNWHLKPHHHGIHNFIHADFDILINLTIEKNFPLKYIFAKTKAKFKIGKYDKKNSRYFDMMIHSNENVSLGKLIELVVHYLNQLRNANLQEA
ncbi:MAG TPA: hypothetical protein VJY62_04405 [Bacteroidia bacterium]|nr:hypothetical protein [Bacteroidia bacterium]